MPPGSDDPSAHASSRAVHPGGEAGAGPDPGPRGWQAVRGRPAPREPFTRTRSPAPGCGVRSRRAYTPAGAGAVSTRAWWIPTHVRLPPPRRTCASRGGVPASSVSHRSRRKRSGRKRSGRKRSWPGKTFRLPAEEPGAVQQGRAAGQGVSGKDGVGGGGAGERVNGPPGARAAVAGPRPRAAPGPRPCRRGGCPAGRGCAAVPLTAAAPCTPARPARPRTPTRRSPAARTARSRPSASSTPTAARRPRRPPRTG